MTLWTRRSRAVISPVIFDSLAGCCLHDPAWTMADVAEFACEWEMPQDEWSYSETHAFYVARLTDGRWGLLEEDADTTGHGCQCGSSATVYDTVADLLRYGVPESETEARAVIAQACGTV